MTEGVPYRTWAEGVLSGEELSRSQALAILRSPDEDILALLGAAWLLRRHHFGHEVRLNYLVNAKSGACGEDCAYCSQSRVSKAEIEMYPRLTEPEIRERMDRGVELGATTCCIVMSGHHPKKSDVAAVEAAATWAKKRYPNLRVCACLGEVTAEQARNLVAAGVDRYNHNLNTPAARYEKICTTHTFEDRKQTARNVIEGGLSLCSGLIVGMGETKEELVDLAFALKETGAHSVPVNFLVPIEGTPLAGHTPPLDPRTCLKVLAMMRFVCPSLEIRVSAGRETHLRSLQPMSLYAANSLFVADYLTTAGQSPSLDWEMIEDLGFTRTTLEPEKESHDGVQ
jgi:biotin synthase